MKRTLIAALLLVVYASHAQMGTWRSSVTGLPVYEFRGTLPVQAVDKSGTDAMLPDDPYFLLGNYKMTLFVHASGMYQFITGERGWARINAANRPNYGWNAAVLTYKNKPINLTGLGSPGSDTAVRKQVGAGFARFDYPLPDGLTCTRTMSVKPSAALHSGNPSFVITVTLKNAGRATQELGYAERIRINYVPVNTQFKSADQQPVTYRPAINLERNNQQATIRLLATPTTFLVLPQPGERYPYDLAPPTVFMRTQAAGNARPCTIITTGDTLSAERKITLKPGETQSFHIVIGLHDAHAFASIEQQVGELLTTAPQPIPADGLFAAQWKSRLPDFTDETDETLRLEMGWNAHFVEASAKYNAYYNETFIPQGTVYAYHFGDNISNRDHAQAALPACYTNPALARSSIRYVLKHTEADGEIKRGDTGFGYTPPSIYKESDEQLFLFNTVAEYLLITKDYAFLNEPVAYFPAEVNKTAPVLTFLKKHFIYLRDEIGTGQHGLVKMLNSDWSDSFFHTYSPNIFAGSAESHLNSVMVLAIFPKLIQALNQSGNPEAITFGSALETYRANIATAFYADFGDRKFAARAYLNNNLKFGLDNVCLEPQGYLLQIPDLSADRKREIYACVKSRNFLPEQNGFRIREKPLWSKRGEGEDGGIWYSLEYPVLLGVATFDKAEARSLLKAFSFHTYAAKFPNYWVGQWTAPDDINSSLSTRQGLYSFWEPDIRRSFQGYCNHPHTWPLFCYYKLKESVN